MKNNKRLTQQLLDLKEQVKQKELAQAEARGRLDELYRQLRNFNCNSQEEAADYAEELRQEIETLKTQIEEGIEKVRAVLGGTNAS